MTYSTRQDVRAATVASEKGADRFGGLPATLPARACASSVLDIARRALARAGSSQRIRGDSKYTPSSPSTEESPR